MRFRSDRSNSESIAGLDPAIHHLAKKMDPRVKPAGDDGVWWSALTPDHAFTGTASMADWNANQYLKFEDAARGRRAI